MLFMTRHTAQLTREPKECLLGDISFLCLRVEGYNHQYPISSRRKESENFILQIQFFKDLSPLDTAGIWAVVGLAILG
jgi:hypothetical protein